MRPLLLTAPITQGARSAITDELGYTIVDRAGTAHESAIRDGAAAGVIGWLLEGDPCGERELSALPDLQWIACVRGGPVNVDIPAATRRGIPVLYAPGRNAAAVADFVVGQIVCLVRHIAQTNHLMRTGSLTEDREVAIRDRKDVIWRPQDPTAPIPYHVYRGRELSTLTLGLLGLGRVGELRRRARARARDAGRGARSLRARAARRHPARRARRAARGLRRALTARARQARRWSGPPSCARCGPARTSINTARATILDYPALVEALRDGHLAGAALDVFPDEPLTAGRPTARRSTTCC